MSVLSIRSQRRFAVRQSVRLRDESGNETTGLMIEVSLEGCRVSGLGEALFMPDSMASMRIDDGPWQSGKVRWAHDALLGFKFHHPLHVKELSEFIGSDRATREQESQLRLFGT